MKGIEYKLKLPNSYFALSCGCMDSFVKEIFLPEAGIAFDKNNIVFKTNTDRYKNAIKIGELEIPNKDVCSLLNYLLAEEKIQKAIEKCLEKS